MYKKVFIIALFMTFIFLAFFSNLPVYLSTSNNSIVRHSSLNLLKSNKFYNYNYFGLDVINFLFHEYMKKKSLGDKFLADEYFQSACHIADNINDSDDLHSIQSISFINAVLENENDMALFWIYRGVNIDRLTLSSVADEEIATYAQRYERIKKITGNNEAFKIAEMYRNNTLNLNKYPNPCLK